MEENARTLRRCWRCKKEIETTALGIKIHYEDCQKGSMEEAKFTPKPDMVNLRKEVEAIIKSFGGKLQIEDWQTANDGGIRILMTWRYRVEMNPNET